MIPNSSNAMDSVLRLQGLKNVSGRRKVLPEDEFLNELEQSNADMKGIGQEVPKMGNFQSQENLPESELGGELTSRSYDVRANSVIDPQAKQAEAPQEDQGNFFTRLGRSIHSLYHPKTENPEMDQAEIPTPTVNMQNLPPQSTQEVMQAPTQSEEIAPHKMVWHNIKNLGSYLKSLVPGTEPYQPEGDPRIPNVPQQVAPTPMQQPDTQQIDHAAIDQAMQQPFQHSVYGSAQKVGNRPLLQEQFKTITGIDYEPQIAQQITDYEGSMQGVMDSLNGIQSSLGEREEQIKQRILSNQTTDEDKYMIGLALLMPLLIGGFFGKEAGLGALGGAAKGFADVLSGRQKALREDEGSLLDIAKQKAGNEEKLANIKLEGAKLRPTLEKNLPEQPDKHLMGMRYKEIMDPETGQPTRAFEVKPDFLAKEQFLNSPEAVKEMRKEATELSNVKTFSDEVNDLTDKIIHITSQLKNEDSANVFHKMFNTFLSGKAPGAISKLSEDVMYEGRKVNAGVKLQELLGFLANAYGMAKQIGQLDRAAQNHITKIMDNPTSTLLTPQDSLEQMLEIRSLIQNGLIKNAENKGFYSDFLREDMEKKNQELFDRLNKKERDKRLSGLKKESYK